MISRAARRFRIQQVSSNRMSQSKSSAVGTTSSSRRQESFVYWSTSLAIGSWYITSYVKWRNLRGGIYEDASGRRHLTRELGEEASGWKHPGVCIQEDASGTTRLGWCVLIKSSWRTHLGETFEGRQLEDGSGHMPHLGRHLEGGIHREASGRIWGGL